MIKACFKITFLLLVLISTGVNAFELSSRSGSSFGATINGTEVQLTYKTGASQDRTATNNATVVTVNAIYGYDPAWVAIPTAGIEPSESATFHYQFNNVGNDWDEQFIVTYSVVYSGSSAPSWNIAISSSNIFLARDGYAEFDLFVTASSTCTPGAYVVVSVNIECVSSLNALPYTGDNGYTYGGYGDAAQVVTTTIMIAVVNLTKTVTINAPVGYAGNPHDPVPGAKLTYDVSWSNTGSQFARNMQIIDFIPTPSASLTSNMSISGVAATTVNYLVNNIWTTVASTNATQLKVEYAIAPAGTTGNIRYDLIIK